MREISHIEKNVIENDQREFDEDPNIRSMIRQYIPGEFSQSFLSEEELSTLQWVKVTRHRGKIVRIPLSNTDLEEIATEIQAQVLNRDEELLEARQEVIEYIRRYVEGEFPSKGYLTKQQLSEIKWVKVVRDGKNITRFPMNQKMFEEVCTVLIPEEVKKDRQQIFVLKVRG